MISPLQPITSPLKIHPTLQAAAARMDPAQFLTMTEKVEQFVSAGACSNLKRLLEGHGIDLSLPVVSQILTGRAIFWRGPDGHRLPSRQDQLDSCWKVTGVALGLQALINDALQILGDVDQVPMGASSVEMLRRVARNVENDAERLRDLIGEIMGAKDESGEERRWRTMAEILADVKESWLLLPDESAKWIVRCECDATIAISGDDFLWALSTFLQYLVDRSQQASCPPGEENPCKLRLTCREVDGYVELTVEDESDRMPAPVRPRLFEPGFVRVTPVYYRDKEVNYNEMSEKEGKAFLAMYVAWTILNLGHRCQFRDETDQRKGERGHRFVFSFPAGQSTTTQL